MLFDKIHMKLWTRVGNLQIRRVGHEPFARISNCDLIWNELILTNSGTDSSDVNFSISWMHPKPRSIFPNTTFEPSKCGESTVVMKNCELFVFGLPKLAIPSVPASFWKTKKHGMNYLNFMKNKLKLLSKNLELITGNFKFSSSKNGP